MDVKKTIGEYLAELSSNSPTPGGGNVSAFCGALASSLGTMVCNLTIGKKKYQDVEKEMTDIKLILEKYIARFTELAVKDNQAFDKVMDAFKLPKETDADKEIRLKKIDEATIEAAQIPSEVIKNCSDIIPLIDVIASKGNQNSVSDSGVAALLLSTAAQGAFLNVLINCSGLKNNEEADQLLQSSRILTDEIKLRSNSITEKIIKGLQS